MNNNSKPNILFIMTDQHRHDYMHCAGKDFLRTPNIDRIAECGMRFTNCFSNGPVCVPARVGLASGLQPANIGCLDNDYYLPASIKTYYHRLCDYGYRVGCSGKLDLAKPDRYNSISGDRPCTFTWGFTHPLEIEGKAHAFSSDTPIGPYTQYLHNKGLLKMFRQSKKAESSFERLCHYSALAAEDYHDTFTGLSAARWLENIPDDFPWHMFVSFAGPHSPFDAPAEYVKHFENVEMPDPIVDDLCDKPKWHKTRVVGLTSEQITKTRRSYAAAIELIDDQIGMILKTLEKRNMLENTYIIFSSDHGEMLGDHGIYEKSIAYEPSLHIPLIVAGPGICGGSLSNAMIELIDINPTICELAGLPEQADIDARSFAPVLYGQKTEHRSDIVASLIKFSCIRTERYKYIKNTNDIDELYDLDNDPDELINIAGEYPDICKKLKSRMIERYMEGKWRR